MYSAGNSVHSSDSDSQDSRLSTTDFFMPVASGGDVITPTTFVTLDGLNSGVPTRTTATLTPTTLRNIEQTLIDLECEVSSHQNEAGFVPPVVQPVSQVGGTYMSLLESKPAWQADVGQQAARPTVVTTASVLPTTVATTATIPVTAANVTAAPRRNVGGRRPTKNTGISPEEEERRRVRRERNKMAAARCRKRRLDHTNALLQETEGLEQKKQGLQLEIQQLTQQKEDLEFLLEAHQRHCRLNGTAGSCSPLDVKPFDYRPPTSVSEEMCVKRETDEDPHGPPPAKRLAPEPSLPGPVAGTGGVAKPPRPNSLPVAAAFTPAAGTLKVAASVSEVAGVPVTTPSAGMPFNFDSLMEGGTGLTPVSAPLIPSCSSQQRNSADLASPDAVPAKLVSL
ncbi:transcription factor kayak isoform X2 [Schistocerca americana]|uniref:transcription factor kayak isoform X2 n=1 Tax=Schistocerca americana TaxID=7009 RepID=UPI001F4F7633|nr:transcription factor kayak isoform X2 [Schistocerca americana]XP_047111050.1 transcription factor kayak isoform X2 [Schistocerca piceifrons]XP_049955204.1 transcription factor kayak isoform X2 [Schistocerca serialis cubense]